MKKTRNAVGSVVYEVEHGDVVVFSDEESGLRLEMRLHPLGRVVTVHGLTPIQIQANLSTSIILKNEPWHV